MNGTNGSPIGDLSGTKNLPQPVQVFSPTSGQFPPEKITDLVAELEVPFDPAVMEWRVTSTMRNGKQRGQIIPYADQRAYTDRLNALFTPAGWTRRYTIHTSANFQRSRDQRVVAKVFVTCDLTIFGIGSHSATGEEWIDDENAGTSAEAQAFKRACSCFGLGRYLYRFTGIWVDLDDHKRPKSQPKLFGWATPEGWRSGLRPPQGEPDSAKPSIPGRSNVEAPVGKNGNAELDTNLVPEIEAMAEVLGRGLYRGLLKNVARAWTPIQIKDVGLRKKVLEHMQAAERGLRRLEAVIEKIGPEPLVAILQSLKVSSIERVDNLTTLHEIVVAMEAKAALRPNHT